MRVTGFPAGMFQTNCYVVSRDEGTDCIVVDPGQDAAAPLYSFLDDAGLTPIAVLLTHGHLDHMWDATPVCARFDIPLYVHPDDRHMLTDPASGIGPVLAPLIAHSTFEEPSTVVELAHGDVLDVAGLGVTVAHTPGHTRGSVVFRLDGGEQQVIFSGDTLFAGSIGRSDLPGGDHEQLLASIAEHLLCLDDETAVLPGHGESTTIGAERGSNPFLVGLGGVR
ncbi:MBL fold metallo-hydrolase [Rhodococcus sp. SORGH_AS_0301]|uniref:MBL fold metallo-hydrolase n=1 Tax=Rhodococcus sp. SORGH_AS_0301 TaxID=3041780 RepID=UPI002782D404|nr:MBL fold metallo-hydrolase [Rhodococcus sp. SORGH_AS_0301]MDQ1180283.1 hydroxyacylglutathione hydrolase [Rhodococcus sp. SORGH_AS_0301]